MQGGWQATDMSSIAIVTAEENTMQKRGATQLKMRFLLYSLLSARLFRCHRIN